MGKWILKHQVVRWGIVCLTLVTLALTTLAVVAGRGQASVLPAKSTVTPSAAIHAVPGLNSRLNEWLTAIVNDDGAINPPWSDVMAASSSRWNG